METKKTTDKDKDLDELMKKVQEEQMRMYPEIYKKPKEETEN